MKKFIVCCQVVVVAFFIVKILLLTDALRFESRSPFSSFNDFGQAIAQTTKPVTDTATNVKDVTDDPLKKERDLFVSLQNKQRDLDIREKSLKAEEEKGLALKKEIMDKIDVLKTLETQLNSKLDMDKTNETKRLQDLAKVYEATPPQRAAAMLEQLEVKTAARITINMKRDRAGLIWGYLTPQKAVAITNEITRTARLTAE
jgi:flagellar motility protein MotE (MotC chaperone)